MTPNTNPPDQEPPAVWPMFQADRAFWAVLRGHTLSRAPDLTSQGACALPHYAHVLTYQLRRELDRAGAARVGPHLEMCELLRRYN